MEGEGEEVEGEVEGEGEGEGEGVAGAGAGGIIEMLIVSSNPRSGRIERKDFAGSKLSPTSIARDSSK